MGPKASELSCMPRPQAPHDGSILGLWEAHSPKHGSLNSETLNPEPRTLHQNHCAQIQAAHGLENKRILGLGKQNPFCKITIAGVCKRTKTHKEGGEDPEWNQVSLKT